MAKLQHEQSISNLLLRLGGEGVLVADDTWSILSANNAIIGATGYDKDHLQDLELESILKDHEIIHEINDSLNKTDKWNGSLIMIDTSGQTVNFSAQVARVDDKSNPHAAFLMILKNVTDELQASKDIDFLKKHDPVTLLPNEFLMRSILDNKISTYNASPEKDHHEGSVFTLAACRLSGLGNLADVYGPAAKNRILTEIADDLVDFLGATSVARIGDSNLAIIINKAFDQDDLDYRLCKVSNIVKKRRTISGNKVKIQFKAGHSSFPRDGSSSGDLISQSRLALNNATATAILPYSSGMTDCIAFEAKIRSELVHAVSVMDFEVVYQPQTLMKSGDMIGVEALLRWKMIDGTVISPVTFIPELERMGAIYDVGLWVLRHCCNQGKQWIDQGVEPFSIAVNISALQLLNDSFGSDILEILSTTRFPPELLELELTESTMVRDPDAADLLMKNLSSLGVGISIDDFGTGYSSLAYLRKFTTLKKLKIDKSFVDSIEEGLENVVTNAIINLAQSLNLKAIAEGVEYDFQQKYLQAHGCDEIQGYLYSKPLSSKQLLEYITAQSEHERINLQLNHLEQSK
jgi:EAL domain-containing protein (putative c-di-GMP-specific phosphodiesterase class I)/GGDEF domain-containing protein